MVWDILTINFTTYLKDGTKENWTAISSKSPAIYLLQKMMMENPLWIKSSMSQGKKAPANGQ